MKRVFLLALCAILLTGLLAGCVSLSFSPWSSGTTITGVGERERFEVPVGAFTEIRFTSVGEIHLYASPSDTVVLEIQPNLREHFEVEVRGGVLHIGAGRGVNFRNTNRLPVITVHAPGLEKLTISGAGTFTAHDVIAADTFELNISGAATGRAEVDAGDFSVTLSGAGTLSLTGAADNARLRLTGAGTIDALDLETRTADVFMSGAGAVRVNCSGKLNINASGAGTVEYKGGASVDISRAGVVVVRRVD